MSLVAGRGTIGALAVGVDLYTENLVWQAVNAQGTDAERLDIILSLNSLRATCQEKQGEHDACRCRQHFFDVEIHALQCFCLMRYIRFL